MTYSRSDLLRIGKQSERRVSDEFVSFNNIPEEIARSPGSPWITIPARKRRRRRKDRKQKRGRRAGVRERLGKQPHKLPLPSILLSNTRSLVNKLDELTLQVAVDKFVKDCSLLIITETWLHSSIPDTAIGLVGRTVHRFDRNKDSGKNRGGGLCVYVNNNWCTNTKTVNSHCSPNLEYVTVKCRPFYLPREFRVVMVTAVYIPPKANASLALESLYDTISEQQSKYPDAVHIVAGDFNHVDLKVALPRFHQRIKCATRAANTLDKCYTNIKHGYRAKQLPHLGQSDHMSLLMLPAYTPVRRSIRASTKTVRMWPEGASQQLQDCFENTNWDVFEHQDLEEQTSAVLGYITHCVDTVTNEKEIQVYPNQKPWITREAC